MKLHELAEKSSINELTTMNNQIEVTGVSDRSTDIHEGFIFVAIEGFETDGHDFIDQAIANGASLIVGQKRMNDLSVPYIQIENTRKAIGQLSSAFYDFPCNKKLVIGVTGTNGKTTTALFIRHLLKQIGYSVSFFGTVFNEVNGVRTKSSLTTPSASMIQSSLAESSDDAVVIEVSSQGLEQHRMEGMAFDYALFTNLQHDHLDYHKTIDAYFLAKKSLFNLLKLEGKAIVYSDDEWGAKLVTLLRLEGKEVLTVGSHEMDSVRLLNTDTETGEIKVGEDYARISAPLLGKYNLVNLLMASTVLLDLGKSLSEINPLAANMEPIPGRFEQYKLNDQINIVVDYAHTPEAVEALLSTLKMVYPNHKLVHLFGFRGNRDTTKREEMVVTSFKYSERIILTLDDLNGVPEEKMLEEYEKYTNKSIYVEMDRTAALQKAVNESQEPTVIVLTGKGHETYQKNFQLGTTSDKETVEQIIKKNT